MKKLLFCLMLMTFVCQSVPAIESARVKEFSSVIGDDKANAREKLVITTVEKFVKSFAKGDVASLKRQVTKLFYREQFPYDDKELEKMLLELPEETRMSMIGNIENNSTFNVMFNGDYKEATVYVVNNNSGNVLTFYLLKEGSRWLINDCE